MNLQDKDFGFDHGAGHPLLFLDDVKAPNCQKNNEFSDLGNYSEWPKVAGAVIQAGDFYRLHNRPLSRGISCYKKAEYRRPYHVKKSRFDVFIKNCVSL